MKWTFPPVTRYPSPVEKTCRSFNIITVELNFTIVTTTQLVGVPVFSLILTVDFNTKGNPSSECIYLGSRNDFL